MFGVSVGEPNPEAITKEIIWADAFEFGCYGAKMLFRGEAYINLQGRLTHDDNCPCEDGPLES